MKKFLLKSSLLLCTLIVGFTPAWGDTKTDVMFAKGFGSYTNNSFPDPGTDYFGVANSTNVTSVTYAMQVFIGSTGAVRGNQTSAASNFSCRNTSTYDGYYISQVSLTVSGGTLDGSTADRSVVYFGSTAYADPNTSAPTGSSTSSSENASGKATLTWVNTNQSASYFILYNLKTSGTALSANSSTALQVTWKKKDDPSDTRTAVNLTSFTATTTTLIIGDNTTTSAGNDQVGWTAAYNYSSSNTSVATVDASGIITGVAKGTATITCSLNVDAEDETYKTGTTYSKTIDITVNKPSHSATFMVNGTQNSTSSVEEDATISFPSISDQAGLKCVGWKTSTISGTSDTEPDGLITSATMSTSDITYHAVFAKLASTTPASVTETALSGFSASDILVIVGSTSTTSYVLPNNGGTNTPSAIVITGGTLTSAMVSASFMWNIGEENGGYIFYPNGSTTTWLYFTNNNNGVRIGKGDAKHFSLSTNGYLTTTETTDQRYLGIYSSTPDWRCYNSETGNIANQTFKFYKYLPETKNYDHYCTTLPMTVPLTADTWASFCPSFDVAIPTDVDVHYATLAGNTLTAHLVSSGKIKAGEGVLLKSAESATYPFYATTDATTLGTANDLFGTPEAYNTEDDLEDYTFYVLGNGGDGIGFYRFEGTIPANKAFLMVDGAFSEAPMIRFVTEEENNATSIQDLQSSDEAVKFIENGQLLILRDGIIYDLLGRIVK